MRRKTMILPLLLALLCALLTACREEASSFEDRDAKPVLYLYPEEETEVTVRLDYGGELTCTYPAYGEDGWTVTAQPDGTLTDENGQVYNYLYWEGISDGAYDFSQGFCVSGAETAAFLEEALETLGLTRREANEFIVYWLPQMEVNAYNLVAFQFEDYTDHAKLTITPEPDSLLRVFMAWRPLTEPVDIPEQELPAFERTGFAAVEWGGAELPFLTTQAAERLIASRQTMIVAEEETTLSLPSYSSGAFLELFYDNGKTVLSARVPLQTQPELTAAQKVLGSVTGRAVANWVIPDNSQPAYGLRRSAADGLYECVYLSGVWLDNRGNALLADVDFPAIWKTLVKEPTKTDPANMPCRMELALQSGLWNHWFMRPSLAENPNRDLPMTLASNNGDLSWTIQNNCGSTLSHGNGGGVILETSLAGWWYTVPLQRPITMEDHVLRPGKSYSRSLAKEFFSGFPDGAYRLVFPLYTHAQTPGEEAAFFGYAAASFQLKNGTPVLS